MADWQQAVGDLAQTSLTTAAIEHERGGGGAPGSEAGADGHTHEGACLNCGTALVGTHCHQCGQHAHVHRTLGAFFHDLLHGVFHFEGRIWRTLPLLVFRPGDLTRRYIDGQRARFISPLALFLFCVFLMFTTFHAVVGEVELNAGNLSAANPQQMAAARREAEQELAKLEAKRAALVAKGQPTEEVDGELTGARMAVNIIRGIGGEKSGQIKVNADVHSDLSTVQRAIDAFKANPKLVFYKVQSNAYKYSWALIPISVPFLWLLFPFSRRFHLYDHTVFVTYSLCMMTLLAVIAMVWGKLGAGTEPGPAPLLLIPPIHMCAQLHGTYGKSWLGSLWRTAALSLFSLIALTLFGLLILAQTGAG